MSESECAHAWSVDEVLLDAHGAETVAVCRLCGQAGLEVRFVPSTERPALPEIELTQAELRRLGRGGRGPE
jgi:hypothetical protein